MTDTTASISARRVNEIASMQHGSIGLTEVVSLATEVQALRAALKPFADAADSLDIIAYEGSVIWGGDGEHFVQVRHFRAARAALTKAPA